MPNLILGNHEYCQRIAEFLQESINRKYQEEVDRNPLLPSRVVIRSTRNYDDPTVTLPEFPVLKVFRNLDIYPGVTPYRDTSATITYSTSYSDLEELPDLLYWFSFALQGALTEFSIQNNGCFDMKNRKRIQVQYLLTAVGNTVYPFIRANIQFKDHLIICHQNKE